MAQIQEELTEIMRKVFKITDLNITPQTTAQSVRGWDSLNHVALILAVEAHYKLKFRAVEVAGLKNVGELIDLIQRKQGITASA